MVQLINTRRAATLELCAAVGGFAALTLAYTFPLGFNLASLGYKLNHTGDAQFSVWNVWWVAHALITDPLNVLNANIFFPSERTLVYSEANLVAGALGAPVYWLTRNAFTTHNFVLLVSFVLSGTGTYYLIRHLTGDRRAAFFGAVSFAYCPFVFGHLPHIQLLMTSGIPFSLLAFHRLVDRPSPGRGAALGVALGYQALACGYYAVFLVLVIGLVVCFTAAWNKWWTDRRYWIAIGIAAGVSLVITSPLIWPYLTLQRETGFARALDESRRWSANWVSYITSARYASAWLRGDRSDWTDVLFPGFPAVIFGLGALLLLRASDPRRRYILGLYALVTGFSLWQSFGPRGGLYSLTYAVVPAFEFLRAPSRFGIFVTFGLSIMGAVAVATLLERTRRSVLVATALIAAAVAASATPIPWTPTPQIARVYYHLAAQPPGGLIELPVYSRPHRALRTQYMLASTVHGKPLVNAYSDMTPAAFSSIRNDLATFPSANAFSKIPPGVRYVIFHVDEYRRNNLLMKLTESLVEFEPSLKLLYADRRAWLFEIDPVSGAQSAHSPSTKTAAR
jgi:hypothetical protein